MTTAIPSNKRIRKHFASQNGAPKCGRQLSRPSASAATQQSMMLTQDPLEVGCRHCLRAMGLLAPVARRVSFDSEGMLEEPAEEVFEEEEELEE